MCTYTHMHIYIYIYYIHIYTPDLVGRRCPQTPSRCPPQGRLRASHAGRRCLPWVVCVICVCFCCSLTLVVAAVATGASRDSPLQALRGAAAPACTL